MIHYSPQKPKQGDYITSLTYISVGVATLALSYYLWIRWLHNVLDTYGLEPHGFCFLWNSTLVSLHAGSDMLIGIAYVFISGTLVYFVSKSHRDLPFHRMFVAFGMFIIACGFTHFLEVWTLWHATYWLSGIVKLFTAAISIATAIVLPFLVPKARLLIEDTKISRQRKIELEQAHQELEITYEKIKELDQIKTDFFASVSHELRTPLTLILGSVLSLPQEQQSADTQLIERNARILLDQVNDLLDIAKLEAGRTEVRYTQIDVVALLKLCLSLFTNSIEEHQITLALDVPQSLKIDVDAEKLQRVFLNLFSNALKFAPVGGIIQCNIRSDGQRMSFTIQDNGPGVPVEQRQTIFERFRQNEHRQTRQGKGTGLGLAIVKEIVELHTGIVWVGDASIGGASFTLELPLRAPANIPVHMNANEIAGLPDTSYKTMVPLDSSEVLSTEERTAPVGPRAQPLVLVIEDNVEMTRLIARVLRSAYRVVAAANGEEGLNKTLTLKPDIILCDIMMPVMDGPQFVAQLRRRPEFDGTPVLILSARADEALRVKLLREGVQDYLVKPFYPEELRVRVENLVVMKATREILQRELSTRSEDIVVLADEIASRQHELQRTLEKLRKNEEHLSHVNKMQSNFIAVVSHEFRTTLTSIHGFSELLRDEEFAVEEVKDYATDINIDAKRLTRMIDELLDLERIKAGKMTFAQEMLDVNALLTAGVQRSQTMITPQHRIELQLDKSLPPLLADPDKITQVVANLLSNAIKYSPEGGVVRIESHLEAQYVHVSIHDQGIGIPADALEIIFESYSRVEGEAKQYIRGTGLGLAIVREIIRAHRGEVWATSILGQGSSFHFTLPLKGQQG